MLSTSVSNRFSTHLISAAPSPIAAFLFLPLEFLTTKSFFSWLFLSFFPPFPLLFSFFYSFISSECTPTSLRSNTYFSAIQIVSDRLHPPPLNPHIYPQFSFFFFYDSLDSPLFWFLISPCLVCPCFFFPSFFLFSRCFYTYLRFCSPFGHWPPSILLWASVHLTRPTDHFTSTHLHLRLRYTRTILLFPFSSSPSPSSAFPVCCSGSIAGIPSRLFLTLLSRSTFLSDYIKLYSVHRRYMTVLSGLSEDPWK